METKFISLSKRLEIHNRIKDGDTEALNQLFTELDRLEAIIRGQEIIMRMAKEKFDSDHFKEPRI